MAKDKILTLDDLYMYYSSTSKRSRHFSAKEDDKNIVVQVPGHIVFEKNDDSKEGLLAVTLQACHTEKNLNGSYISKEVMEKALPSFSNRPILAYIHKVDGEWQFYDHRSHSEDGEIVYDEAPIGIVPESGNPRLEYDEDKEKTYVVVDGYIFEEYSPAAEILERDGGCDVSVELNIRELDYNSKEDTLNIEDFFFSGVTALGVDPEGDKVNPGMAGSNMKLSDFTRKTTFSQDNVMEILAEINHKLDQFQIDNSRKEEQMMQSEEIVEAQEFTAEEVVVEETSEEVTEEATTEEFAEEVAEDDAEAEAKEDDEDATPSEEKEKEEKSEFTFSIKVGEVEHTFAAQSLADVMSGLTDLVNTTYAEDGTWYYVDVFSGSTAKDKFVVMVDPWTGVAYRQQYTVKDGVYALKGDRVAVKSMWVTDDEAADLEKMRGNYSAIETELNLYKAEPEKLEILSSDDYSEIKETEEYKELSKRDGYFKLDKEELSKKLDEILLSYAKAHKIEFAQVEQPVPTVTMKPLPVSAKKGTGVGRYGSLFAK